MKKSSVLILFVLVCLTGISIYIYKTKGSLSTVDEDSRNFRFKDTASITRIFIADKDGNQSDIKRDKTGWKVNNKYPCRSEAVLNLLEVIKLVEVKMPVPKTARETVIKYMAAQAIKVEVYAGDKLVRQYYVGHETEDSEGSYMLLTDVESGENYKDPFVCFIPGFKGFLLPRFIANENEWRDRIVLNYIPPQLKQVKLLHYGAMADSSFTIELLNSNSFKVKDAKNQDINFDEAKLRQYLVYLQNISYEVLLSGKNKKLQDSLLGVKPFATLEITNLDLKVDKYSFYRKKFMGDVNPELGVSYTYDPDRFYLSFNADKEWALIQYYVFGKLLISSRYFQGAVSVKK
jgi:hypothetical protein